MSEEWRDLLEKLPDYLGGHMLLSVAALTLGIAMCLPLGIIASRRPRLAETLLGAASILQTIPTLALLVLMVPLLGGLIGNWPAFVALTLYSLLPILANTVLGIRGVDPTLVEAARGLGMSERQLLRGVQLPLATPVIIGGVRTATVLVVGTATLATPVGGRSLGNYIFSGLEMNNMTATLFGCILAAALALVMDQLVRLLEVASRRRNRHLAYVALGGLGLVLAGGLYGPIARLFRPEPVVIAGAPFTEQFILAEVMKQKLLAAGIPEVDQRPGMGETIQFLALKHNQIDCCVNYTGNVWVTLMREKRVPKSRKEAFDRATTELHGKYGIHCLGRLGFENAYVFVMQKTFAEEKGIESIDDLTTKAEPSWEIGGDTQFFERPEWRHVRDAKKLKFARTRAMDPTLLYDAVGGRSAKVQVICAYSSDARTKRDSLLILKGSEQVFPPYDAVLLLSPKAAANPTIRAALQPLVDNIKQQMMENANERVDRHHESPRVAASQLLQTIDARP